MLGVLIANTNPGPLSSSLYNTLDATDKRKKKKKGNGGEIEKEGVCRMCWENRAQWYIADEYFKGSSVIWREEKKWRHRRSLKEIRTWGRTQRLIPEEDHSFRVFSLYVSVENAALLHRYNLSHTLNIIYIKPVVSCPCCSLVLCCDRWRCRPLEKNNQSLRVSG